MKNFIYIIVAGAFLVACGSHPKTAFHEENLTGYASSEINGDTVKIANDSLGYKIIIFEPGFRSFLATQPPRGHYSLGYLERNNWLYVLTYNSRVLNPSRNQDLYPFRINYSREVDYGYEVNYLLYNYFQYFMQKYNQNL